VLDLLANILMVVGIYFLSRAILCAADPHDFPSSQDSWVLAVLGLVIVGFIACFSMIERPHSSTKFLMEFCSAGSGVRSRSAGSRRTGLR
jgi:hypothetical protein